MTMGDRLKEERTRLGLSQAALAAAAGIPKATLVGYELGRRVPGGDALRSLASAGVDIHYVLTGVRSGGLVRVPVIDVEAAAGGGALIDSEKVVDWLGFRSDWLRRQVGTPNQAIVVRIVGDSMEPTLSHGDAVLVDMRARHQEPRDGIYIVRIGDLAMAKRVQPLGRRRVRLISDNPAYPPMDVRLGEDGEAEIIGRVVWVGRTVR